MTTQAISLFNFNPRSPWGERHVKVSRLFNNYGFQSTLPVGGATESGIAFLDAVRISIHAPRGGSDLFVAYDEPLLLAFQSTLPVGGATRRIQAIDGR